MRATRTPVAFAASVGGLLLLCGCDAAQAALQQAHEAAATAASSAASAAVQAATAATTTSGPEKTATFDWKGRIDVGKTLEIRGINGGVTARLADGPDATVHATLTGRDDDPTEVQIQVVPHDGSVTLCAVYPGRHNGCEPGGGHESIHRNDVRVEFEVAVPAGVVFTPSTVNGGIRAEGLKGPVRARTVNGTVRLETTGWADAHSVNGSLDVRMGSTASSDGLSFKTVNGSISVALPADAAFDVDASTVSGSISTDFPLTISGRFVNHHASGTIGGGGPELSLKTVNGSIGLQKRS
ncbi:MAG: DUF4097 family beta strand repeat-containing protein [Candidatus Palauibacterales bacterium]|nr:DUF4097 family beta strand repeat-containing protein [Candidatus Palauibacterales bacterium]MDP2528889.1 DUF4097 family beta strand repeat-containing protein [Candidatus Palauibacterales bacterium]MDP2584470.1 DUF4097 family beta strand repeat-containing protein [Candidatus Palauibacterales bacterium]